MRYRVGDIVTRNSYQNDTVFKIIKIEDDTCFLKGVNTRLLADASINDLKPHDLNDDIENESVFNERIREKIPLNRSDYFYLPGRILHIDGDSDYLNRCLDYYKGNNINAIGINEVEETLASNIKKLLEEYKPNIVVITGHDAYYKKNDSYKNSSNFINAVKEARNYESSHDKLIIIAGACQSNYEELIKSGANFASSPKRINIHALDPAIIATQVSLLETTKDINLMDILEKTKYGSNGMGGIRTKGTMYVGYPR